MKRLIFCSLFVSTLVCSQTIRTEWAKLNADKMANVERQTKNKADLIFYEAELQKSRDDIELLNIRTKNKQKFADEAFKEVNVALDNLSNADRKSPKAAFYKCVQTYLKTKGYASIQKCQYQHKANFSIEDELLIKKWNETISLGPIDIQFRQEKIIAEMEITQAKLNNTKVLMAQTVKVSEMHLDSERLLKMKENEQKIIAANQSYINCDKNSSEISLEEKVPFPDADFDGPFFGVPRDHQDGLGTCYANTAKNLLVGISKGKDIASFLDLALIFQGDGVILNGLDGGDTCSVLNEVKKVGYCPQTFAPYEIGEKNKFIESLMGTTFKGSVYDQSMIISLLQKFLASETNFVENNSQLSEQFVKQAKIMIQNIKSSPTVQIPMPILRYQIPAQWKIDVLIESTAFKANFTGSDFLADYKKEYRNFYPQYIRGVMEGKSRHDIFQTFLLKMKPLIDKYKLAAHLKSWESLFLIDTEDDWNNPNLRKEIADSVAVLKIIAGKKDSSDREFIQFCEESAGDSFNFLQTFQPLVKYLLANKINTDVLFSANGKFKSATELMQLAVAPACLNTNNRETDIDDFSCVRGTSTIVDIRASGKDEEGQRRMLRERVVASLLQGYALGNTFDKHINTVVGMRFNKANLKCEYKIRESQTGMSSWQSEKEIFSNIDSLTEVRRD